MFKFKERNQKNTLRFYKKTFPMKTTLKMLVLILFVAAFACFSCSDDFSGRNSGDGISIVFGKDVLLSSEDIDSYSSSAHIIYLKGNNSFLKQELYRDSFHVFASGEKIYSGYINSWFSSNMPSGPVIFTPVTFYPEYILPIQLIRTIDLNGKMNADPRGDARIVSALKRSGQFQEGLKCELRSVQFTSKNEVLIQLGLINDDLLDYMYLDPSKMGMSLFHYFTNGLSFFDTKTYQSYSNNVQHIQPVPFDSWKKEWLTVIPKKSEVTIWIKYDKFDIVPAGKYRLNFSFPGLNNVAKTDLFQGKARVWIGDLDISQDFVKN